MYKEVRGIGKKYSKLLVGQRQQVGIGRPSSEVAFTATVFISRCNKFLQLIW